MKYPSPDKYVNFNSDMGSNGQYDELALIMFIEDNPEQEENLNHNLFGLYCDALQKNFEDMKDSRFGL